MEQTNGDLTDDVAQIRDLVLRPVAGRVQRGHNQIFQPPQDPEGAPKAVHGVDGLPETESSTLTTHSKQPTANLMTSTR